ncbi:hypothetical protein, partial [Desulfatibacillum alkenivorans]|uniref:hypothetical protein n=1 Tax=Desulfatibacillum alkenivorans TaxID=259354 RepID=UPI001B8B2C64
IPSCCHLSNLLIRFPGFGSTPRRYSGKTMGPRFRDCVTMIAKQPQSSRRPPSTGMTESGGHAGQRGGEAAPGILIKGLQAPFALSLTANNRHPGKGDPAF